MDQELVSLLQSPDREKAAKGAQMLAAFLSKASFPSKSVQALREVTLRHGRTVLSPRRSRRALRPTCWRGRIGACVRAHMPVRACMCESECARACLAGRERRGLMGLQLPR